MKLFSIKPFSGITPDFLKGTRVTPRRIYRKPFYLGRTPNGYKVFHFISPDIGFNNRILITGGSGTGKTVLSKIICENLYMEYCISLNRNHPTLWRHPIFVWDVKSNHLGIDKPNRFKRDITLLEKVHGKKMRYGLDSKDINIFTPAYACPFQDKAKRERRMRQLKKQFGVKELWKINWRKVTDIYFLAQLFNLNVARAQWINEIQPTFEKSIGDPDIDLDTLLGKGGILETRVNTIRSGSSKSAGKEFIKRWRERKYMFCDQDLFSKHVHDDFSYNVLDFQPVANQIWANQVSLLVSILCLKEEFLKVKKLSQPVLVIHDVLNFLDKKKPLHNDVSMAIAEFITGMGRKKNIGLIIIIESQGEKELPSNLKNVENRYNYVFRLKQSGDIPPEFRPPFYWGGIVEYYDRVHGVEFKGSNCVFLRPSYTHYET